VGISGYDIAIHSIIKYLLPVKAEKRDFINVISLNESKETLEELNRLLHALGIETNIFPRYSNLEKIADAANATYNLVLNIGEGEYFAKVLSDLYNIPYLELNSPIGIRGTEKWLTALGKQLNREKEAKAIAEAQAVADKINAVSLQVIGKVAEGSSKLYGSITSGDIAEALQSKHGIQVDKRKIDLPEHIKSLGEYTIPIQLHRKVTAQLKLQVVEG
jgi:ribosomal protein L9